MKSRGFCNWVPLGTAQTPDHHFFGVLEFQTFWCAQMHMLRHRRESQRVRASSRAVRRSPAGSAVARPLLPVELWTEPTRLISNRSNTGSNWAPRGCEASVTFFF